MSRHRDPHSPVAAQDVAAFAVGAVNNPDAENRVIPIGGPQPLSLPDAAGVAEPMLGRLVTVRCLTADQPPAGWSPLMVQLVMLGSNAGFTLDTTALSGHSRPADVARGVPRRRRADSFHGREDVRRVVIASGRLGGAERASARRWTRPDTMSPVPALPRPVVAFLEGGPLAHVVTLDAQGAPHVSMAWVGVEDGEVVIGTLMDQPKLRNLRRDPRIAMSFEAPGRDPYGLDHYLVLRGRARVTEGGAATLLRRLAQVYLGPGVDFPPMPHPPAGYVIRMTVDKVSGNGPWSEE